MLHNLGAAHKSTFHHLGMGPGKMLIQTYLQYDNLTRCMGVELAKGRYDLGEQNMRTLLKMGWRGRSFLGVEFKKGEFFKIVEDVPNKTPAAGWKLGDRVVAYSPMLKKDKMTVKDYHGVITEIHSDDSGDLKKSTFDIQYDDGTTCDRVRHRYLFTPGPPMHDFSFTDSALSRLRSLIFFVFSAFSEPASLHDVHTVNAPKSLVSDCFVFLN